MNYDDTDWFLVADSECPDPREAIWHERSPKSLVVGVCVLLAAVALIAAAVL